LQRTLGLKDAEHFHQHYLAPALAARLIEMALPDEPNSRLQKYRLTAKGRAQLGPE
jgi:ATP-dependent DNA helicase RecG